MEIKYTRKFLKKFKRLTDKEKLQVVKTQDLFKSNVKHPSLRLHKLSGDLYDMWSISVNMRLRIIIYPKHDFLQVIFLDIGGHEIYK